MDVKESDILGDDVGAHWYYRAKSAALRRIVMELRPAEILDVGAGSGFFAKELLRHSPAERAVCVDTAYPNDSEARIAGKPIHFRRAEGRCDPDLILLMDVLEHVDDDLGFLQGCVGHVREGAHILISVPAFGFLWSGHDVFLQHKRRYTIASLRPVIAAAGLEPVRMHYYFAAVFPLAAALRMSERLMRGHAVEPGSQLRKHGQLTNAILRGLCAMERSVMRYNRLFGLTVFALCRKA